MKKILLVEDDAAIREALTIRLEAAGYHVICAEDGLQGVATAVRERPQLLILDVSMPAGDGFSIVERLQTHTDLPPTPIIYLTASKRPEYPRRALELGAFAFFTKPFDSTELLAAVADALEDGWVMVS